MKNDARCREQRLDGVTGKGGRRRQGVESTLEDWLRRLEPLSVGHDAAGATRGVGRDAESEEAGRHASRNSY